MALITKKRYWPKYIGCDKIDKHFENKEIGYVDSLPGKMHDIPFHLFGMKEPDYVMKLTSTCGTGPQSIALIDSSPSYLPLVKSILIWQKRILYVIQSLDHSWSLGNFLPKELIDNTFLAEEQNKFELRCNKRQCTIHSHSLVSLPPQNNSKDEKSFEQQIDILRLDALWGTEKLGPTVYIPQVSFDTNSALFCTV